MEIQFLEEIDLCFCVSWNKFFSQAFKLFDCDGDGNITASELKALIEKVMKILTFERSKVLIGSQPSKLYIFNAAL